MARTATRRKAKPAARRTASASTPQPAARLVAETPVAEEQPRYTVVDELAKTKPRTHEVYVTRRRGDGRREKVLTSFTFHPGEPLPVVREVAIHLAKIDGFTVRTPSGVRIKPAPPQDNRTDGTVKLNPGQVVAEIAELTDEALLKRARHLPGGDALPRSPKRADLIDFVLAGGADVDEFDEGDVEFEDDPDDMPAATARRPSPAPAPTPAPTTAADIERALHAGVDSVASGGADDADDDLVDDEPGED